MNISMTSAYTVKIIWSITLLDMYVLWMSEMVALFYISVIKVFNMILSISLLLITFYQTEWKKIIAPQLLVIY